MLMVLALLYCAAVAMLLKHVITSIVYIQKRQKRLRTTHVHMPTAEKSASDAYMPGASSVVPIGRIDADRNDAPCHTCMRWAALVPVIHMLPAPATPSNVLPGARTLGPYGAQPQPSDVSGPQWSGGIKRGYVHRDRTLTPS
ncbi:hypothetical protein GY45DRAFT_1101844 [Cubamyces sp. BRFM 1775]|nr:hypothetical protein GY45DRAFT_1101844 [Cubamyces sp. BRFM 1775]